LFTAIVSWGTVAALIPIVPKALALRSARELEQEIDERRRVEQSLRESEDRFRLLIEGVKDYGIFMLDVEGRVVSWNAGAGRIHGYDANEILGRHISVFFPPEPPARQAANDALRAATERGRHEYQGWMLRKDGTRFWADVMLTALRGQDGNLRGFADLTRDGTDRKHAEETLQTLFNELEARVQERTAALAEANVSLQTEIVERKKAQEGREQLLESERSARSHAERANRMKDEFLSTLSHELRTPMNAILGWSRVLKIQFKEPGDLRDGLTVIERNTRAQIQLIDDLLDMSRIISGKLKINVDPIDLATVIENALETVRPAADAKQIRISTALDTGVDPVLGDANRLQQVFWNLLSNAIKFSPTGSQVDVTLARFNAHVEVAVSDHGQGIKPEFLPNVFDRFRQADSSTTRQHGGLGLGLAIVKHVVELHGGTVRVSSPGEGAGATFVVALPLHGVHVADTADDETRPQARFARPPDFDLPSLNGVTILVVDDEPDSLDLVRRVLEERHATVMVASSVPEALAEFDRRVPDILLSDIGMPGQDGYELIRTIRLRPPERGGTIPAAALTAFARSEDRLRAMLAGYQTHLVKPVEPLELVAAVAALAGRTKQ
jgi:PAS domain S-box-containing protein